MYIGSSIIGTGKLPRFLDIVPFSSIVIRNYTPPFSPLYAAPFPSFNRSFIQNAKSMNVIFGESWRLRVTDASYALFFFLYTFTRNGRRHLLCAFPHFFSFLSSFFLLPSSARHFGTNRKANNASQRCRIRRDLKIDRDPCNVILETLKTGFLRILPCKSSLFVYGAISSSIKRTYLPGVREKNVAEIKRAVKFSTLITTFLNLFSTRGQPRDIERK